MPQCTLIIDSCCDLPHELIEREGVVLLHFPYIMDGGTFEDDLFQSTTPQDFYGAMRKGAEPSTSQVPMVQFTEVFEQARAAGLPAVYLSFSSGLSGSYDVAMLVRGSSPSILTSSCTWWTHASPRSPRRCSCSRRSNSTRTA